MASERQVLLSIITLLLVLFVVREISTLKAAEERPTVVDPSYPNFWSELQNGGTDGTDGAVPPASGHATARPPVLPSPERSTGSTDDGQRIIQAVATAAPPTPPGALAAALRAAAPSARTEAAKLAVPGEPMLVSASSPSSPSPPPPARRASLPSREAPVPVGASAEPVFKTKHHEGKKRGGSGLHLPKIGGMGLAKKRGRNEAPRDRSNVVRNGTADGRARTSAGAGEGAGGGLPFAGVFMCHDVSESYGAAWIISREKFLATGFGPPWTKPFDTADMRSPGWSVGGNVTFMGVNMEGASHIVLKRTKGALKTVDAFEFLVEHLSIYERRLGLLHLPDKHRPAVMQRVIKVMQKREQALRLGWELGADADRSGAPHALTPPSGGSLAGVGEAEAAVRRAFRAVAGGTAWGRGGGFAGRLGSGGKEEPLGDRVVACMPFYGSGVGTGHSMAQTRFVYLNATYFSIAKVFKHVVVFVENDADAEYCRRSSGLPFFEVILVRGLANPKLLGVATVLEMQRKFQTREWTFDWMYFTESDQVLHLRPHQLADLLAKASGPTDMVAPHRFLPFPHRKDFDEGYFDTLKAMTSGLKRELDVIEAKRMVHVKDETAARCCFDRGDCRKREQWVDWKEKPGSKPPPRAAAPTVHLLRSSGSTALINGEGNLFKMSFRTCMLQEGGGC